VDIKDIKAIIDLMKKNSISEFELERQEFKIKLKRGTGQTVQFEDYAPSPAYMMPGGGAGGAVAFPSPGALGPLGVGAPVPAKGSDDAEVKSPMIGTLYRAPSPESENYVEVGSDVNPDTVVSIIEAMKVMNEIKAEVNGVVAEILVENAKPVEFGQPLFRIKPA
jgi:acetyl-CoA carboxylase biotin carboxyl carrier protein